jgi:hypothetical protein
MWQNHGDSHRALKNHGMGCGSIVKEFKEQTIEFKAIPGRGPGIGTF